MSKPIKTYPLLKALDLKVSDFHADAGHQRVNTLLVMERFLKESLEQHPERAGHTDAIPWREAYMAYLLLSDPVILDDYLAEGHDVWATKHRSMLQLPELRGWQEVHMEVVAAAAELELIEGPGDREARPETMVSMRMELMKRWANKLAPVWRHDHVLGEALSRGRHDLLDAWNPRPVIQAVLDSRREYELANLADARFSVVFRNLGWAVRGRDVGVSISALGAKEAALWQPSAAEVAAGLGECPHFTITISAQWWLAVRELRDYTGTPGVAAIRAFHKLLTQARGPMVPGKAKVEDLPIQQSPAHLALHGPGTFAEAAAIHAAAQHPRTAALLRRGGNLEPDFFQPEERQSAAGQQRQVDLFESGQNSDLALAREVAALARDTHAEHFLGLDLEQVAAFADELIEVAAGRALTGAERRALLNHQSTLSLN